jgi:Cft2 family RNA processing exonuclease
MVLKFSAGNGIALKVGKQTILFDPQISDFISFISHAHADHSPFAFVTKPYCTEETYELIKLRDPYFEANIVKENEKIKFDNFTAKLISAGHVLGSVQTVIEADGQKIIYAGDFKTSRGLTCKPIQIEQADILIAESTYGAPHYVFEPIEQIRKKMMEWVNKQLRANYSVDLGGYQIGKSQEAIKLLNDHDIVPKVTETIRRYSEVYKKFGVDLKFLKPGEEHKILVKPVHLLKQRAKNIKLCALTGWSVDAGSSKVASCDASFALSDHCDFKQILDYVEQVNPKKVYCIHGYTHELARAIKKKLKISAKTLAAPVVGFEQRFLTEF